MDKKGHFSDIYARVDQGNIVEIEVGIALWLCRRRFYYVGAGKSLRLNRGETGWFIMELNK